MASYAVEEIDFLKKLHKCGKSKRPHLASECQEKQVFAVCECSDNYLRGKIPATTRQKQRLKKHVNILKNLADPSINWKKKRTYIATQEGGAVISTLLGIALPALLSYLTSR